MSTASNQYLTRRPLVLGLSKVLFLSLGQIPAVRAVPVHLSQFLSASAGEPDPKAPDDPSLWIYLAVAATLVLLGGAFAGLTIALMGQDEVYLQVIADSGEGSEKQHAAKVLRLLKRGKHWVLVTLLLSNVITNETLPIVLDRSLGGGWPAVLGSTVLIGKQIPRLFTVKLLTFCSHLWRSCPSVDMRAVRSAHRSMDVKLRFGLDVHLGYRGLADCKIVGLVTWRRSWHNVQEIRTENTGLAASKYGRIWPASTCR